MRHFDDFNPLFFLDLPDPAGWHATGRDRPPVPALPDQPGQPGAGAVCGCAPANLRIPFHLPRLANITAWASVLPRLRQPMAHSCPVRDLPVPHLEWGSLLTGCVRRRRCLLTGRCGRCREHPLQHHLWDPRGPGGDPGAGARFYVSNPHGRRVCQHGTSWNTALHCCIVHCCIVQGCRC